MRDTVFYIFFPEQCADISAFRNKVQLGKIHANLTLLSQVGICVCIFTVCNRSFGCSNQCSWRSCYHLCTFFFGGCNALAQKMLSVEGGSLTLDLLGMMGMYDMIVICFRKEALHICFYYSTEMHRDGK